MLRLTTTEAFSVVMEALTTPTPHLPVVDEIGIFTNKAGRWSGYIHGTAQDEAGFDIPSFISGTLPDASGEFAATLVLPDKEIACTIVQWKPRSGHWNYRALICASDDTTGLAQARQHAALNTNHL